MLELAAGDYRLEIDPSRGGAVTLFEWRGKSVLRPACGPSVLDVASFPLVPFSNRIGWGRFEVDGQQIVLAPNFPGSDHPHTIHGFGWLAQWDVVEADERGVKLEHRYPGGEWPWPYLCKQRIDISDDGLAMSLSLTNLGDSAMPAGLGFHPYFPRDPDTVYHGLHRGEWHNAETSLPQRLDLRSDARDWWDGAPIGDRSVDTLYTDRSGPLRIDWPSRGMSAVITPSTSLPHTVVYTPTELDFFCVEPVSHMTNAVNMTGTGAELKWIAPGEDFIAAVSLTVAELAPS